MFLLLLKRPGLQLARRYLNTSRINMGKVKVLQLGQVLDAQQSWAELQRDYADVVVPDATDRTEFIKECKSGKLDGVVACFRTVASAKITGRFDEELTEALPSSLKYVCHNGAGYDQISIPAISKRQTLVTNVPTAVDDATADTALFLTIGALRRVTRPMLDIRSQNWVGEWFWQPGNDPRGKQLGILGMGGIGKNYAFKAKALGMNIQYHNRNKIENDPDVNDKLNAKYVSFEELLATSDVISVHVPLNPKTKYLINKAALSKCKKGVVIINTARGAVINEADLVEALESEQVGAVGLDVFEAEPQVNEGLVRNDRAFLLPHLGTFTYETRRAMEEWVINNIRYALAWEAGDVSQGKKMSVVPELRGRWEEWLQQQK